MNDVNPINPFQFYCQPILPLVYDESLSYYETLCKVVGQLNTTGDTVNQLNEGLTQEISARQSADAVLSERLTAIEKTNARLHFILFDSAGRPLSDAPTREELATWLSGGDLIAVGVNPDPNDVYARYAMASSFSATGVTNPESMLADFFVPVSMTNQGGVSGSDYEQTVMKISLPVGSLDQQWTVTTYKYKVPDTTADGFVNLYVDVAQDGSITATGAPSWFIDVFNNHGRTDKLAVAVNARLNYDNKKFSSAVAVVDAINKNVCISFDAPNVDFSGDNVVQENATKLCLVGNGNTDTWSLESSTGYELITVTSTKVTDLGYSASDGAAKYSVIFDAGFDSILANLAANRAMKFDITLPDSTTGLSISFSTGYVSALEDSQYLFTGTIASCPVVLSISKLGSATVYLYSSYLPDPNPDDSDDGKGLVVNKHKWEIKAFPASGSTDAVLYTEQTLTDEQKKQARENVGAENANNGLNAVTLKCPGYLVGNPDIEFKAYVKDGSILPYPDDADNDIKYAYGHLNLLLNGGLQNVTDSVAKSTTKRLAKCVESGLITLPFTCYGQSFNDTNRYIKMQNTSAGFRVYAKCFTNAYFDYTYNSSGDSYPYGSLSTMPIQQHSSNPGETATVTQFSMQAAPTSDMQIATKKYVDDSVAGDGSGAVRYDEVQSLEFTQKKQARDNIDAAAATSPQVTGFITLTPAGGTSGAGVGLSPSGSGNNYTLDISDVNEGNPSKLTGVATPTDADTNAAATVEYVLSKVSSASVVVNGEEVTSYDFAGIVEEISRGTCNIWLKVSQQVIRLSSYKPISSGSYQLIFIGSSGGSAIDIHEVTASQSAASYSITTK